MGGGHATEHPRRRQQQPVVRPDEEVAAGGPQGDGPARGADTRVDDRQVHADRQVPDGPGQQEGAVADGELGDLVVQVEESRVRGDPPHDPATGGRCRLAPEIGQERDERPGHLRPAG